MNDKTDPPDLRVYKTTKRQQEVQGMIDGLENLEANKEQIMAYQKLSAELKHAKFTSLREAGFSHKDALKMVMESAELI